ncbi:rod shape-determining protein RodA [Dethiosulfovibrio salsuginis]|uniref:Peptidoglycan glycosyltransferase RodA n=1 Tax=Dethiosulfovibrio salsuginis TaxID=561720 RepID=A0A1X7J9A8_9BACT|nr:rod shape-determining protein RodA [Dethiosulfovibrio salsuginis]SMG24335.1 rod shape determining protein RodA [Dethiosulfovibrio salsuginis]
MSEERGSSVGLLRAIDIPLIIAVLALTSIGIMSIYSAASGVNVSGLALARRQLVWGGLSLLISLLIVKIGYRSIVKSSYILYGVLILFLLFMMVQGEVSKGALRWLSVGPIRIQPSEPGKILLSLFLAKFMAYKEMTDLIDFAKVWALGGLSAFLILIQPDLGTSLVYFTVIFSALIVGGARKRHLLGLIGIGLAILPFAWHGLKSYQKQRLLVFINPESDPLGAGYNVIQSRIAVGSGSLWGKGFMNGTQSKLKFLPEPHTDFIFSVFSEEWGFLGCLLVLALFAFVMWRMISIAIKSKDRRGKVLVGALTGWIWFQTVESVGMSIGLLPVTGAPLPFLSYGGSALVSVFIAIGLVISVGLTDEMERNQYDT